MTAAEKKLLDKLQVVPKLSGDYRWAVEEEARVELLAEVVAPAKTAKRTFRQYTEALIPLGIAVFNIRKSIVKTDGDLDINGDSNAAKTQMRALLNFMLHGVSDEDEASERESLRRSITRYARKAADAWLVEQADAQAVEQIEAAGVEPDSDEAETIREALRTAALAPYRKEAADRMNLSDSPSDKLEQQRKVVRGHVASAVKATDGNPTLLLESIVGHLTHLGTSVILASRPDSKVKVKVGDMKRYGARGTELLTAILTFVTGDPEGMTEDKLAALLDAKGIGFVRPEAEVVETTVETEAPADAEKVAA